MKISHCENLIIQIEVVQEWQTVERHCKTLRRVLEENDLLNSHNKTFNTDESGINMDLREGKIVVSHGFKQAHSQSKGSCDHITVNCAISVAGAALPPMIIFEKSFPSSTYITQGPINALYAKSPNGYMDEELFYSWFSNSLSHKPTTWGNKF